MLQVKKNYIAFVIPFLIIVLTIFFFWDLLKTFYQQDEWNGLGLVFSDGLKSVFPPTFKPLDLIFVKGRLLSTFIFYLIVKNFPFQNLPFAIIAVALHTVATLLVYLLIKKYVKSVFASLLGALFFALNSVSHGAVTWPFVAVSTVGSTILILLSTLFFLKFATKEDNKKKWLLFSGLSLYFSLWFKEAGLHLFALFPLAAIIFQRYKPVEFLKKFWLFIVVFFAIVGYRVLELRLGTPDPNLYISGEDENFILTLVVRGVLYPLTSLSLMFVPGSSFIEFSREVIHDVYPYFADDSNFVLIAQTISIDALSLVLTGLILFSIFFFLRMEGVEKKKTVLFWLIFTLTSFLPYIVLAKDFSYLESRYYYLPAAGGAYLISWITKRTQETFKKASLVLLIPVCALFLLWHANTVRAAVDEQLLLSNTRKSFIDQLKDQLPTLNKKKNIFYVNSDKHYWADTNMLPFQQGSGYTLMVLYYDSGKIPKEFLQEGYLFEIGSQGYKEIGSQGFGFFWEGNELEKTREKYKIPAENIIMLNYHSEKEELDVKIYD